MVSRKIPTFAGKPGKPLQDLLPSMPKAIFLNGVTMAISEDQAMKIRFIQSTIRQNHGTDPKYVITGINVLTGHREEISGPMDEQAARARLEREIESRRHQRYQPLKRLRVEKRLPVQLTLKFQDHEQ